MVKPAASEWKSCELESAKSDVAHIQSPHRKFAKFKVESCAFFAR